MVMLRSDVPVPAADNQRQFAENWPSLPVVADADEQDGIVSFRLGASHIMIAKMPAPIAWSDLEGPYATSVLWRNATKEVRQHTIHWIVTVHGELNPVEMAILLTQATACVLAASALAIGVYWGNAGMVIPKNIFIDFSKEVLPHGPPLDVWVDFRVGWETNKTSAGFTTGMKALGHMEFEAQTTPESPSELRKRFLALAGYVLENGAVIRDGDTVGEDADERIRVVYANSAFGHEGQVMRLEYERAAPKKPWWKP